MANLTVRNIPEDVFGKIKVLAVLENRSVNNEMLVIIAGGTDMAVKDRFRDRKPISRETQVRLWKDLAGRWEDTRATEEIIEDIRSSRTLGRAFPHDPA